MIGNYAFPVVVCLWFMFRTEKVIQSNTDVMIEIKEEMQRWKK